MRQSKSEEMNMNTKISSSRCPRKLFWRTLGVSAMVAVALSFGARAENNSDVADPVANPVVPPMTSPTGGMVPGIYPSVPPTGMDPVQWETHWRDRERAATQWAETLAKDEMLGSNAIEIHRVNDRIVLLGHVPDETTQERIEDTLDELDTGGIYIERHIQVLRDDVRTDQEIKEAVESQFAWSLSVDGSNIDIAVQDGAVTLSGMVDDYDEKLNASENAYEGGARRVNNQLRVEDSRGIGEEITAEGGTQVAGVSSTRYSSRWTSRSHVPEGMDRAQWDTYWGDREQAATKWADTLAKDEMLNQHAVEIHRVNDRIVLLGHVPDEATQERIEDTLDELDTGGIDIEQHIAVLDNEARSDLEIKEAIESQFAWSLSVDGSNITVSVQDGTATLSGVVDDYEEKLTASENAYDAGALRVDNQLRVQERENTGEELTAPDSPASSD